MLFFGGNNCFMLLINSYIIFIFKLTVIHPRLTYTLPTQRSLPSIKSFTYQPNTEDQMAQVNIGWVVTPNEA